MVQESEKLNLYFYGPFFMMNKQILFAVIPALIAFLLIGSSIVSATLPSSSQSGAISSTQNGPDGKPGGKLYSFTAYL